MTLADQFQKMSLIGLIAVASFAHATTVTAATITVLVVSVHDDDTIT